MISYTIYIIDDEETIRDGLSMALETEYQVETFSIAEKAIRKITENPPDLILLDIGLPGMNGIDALGKIKIICPHVPVIMITAFEDISTVISAMKLGAYDYVVKPIQMDSLEIDIKNALETIRLHKEVRLLQKKILAENLPCFIGESDRIQDMMEFMEMVAKSPDTPVLILGETGTGKELIAAAIHCHSPNFRKQMVTVNCAAIPKDLIESEIFGYEKGAFSGANPSGKRGLIEEAKDGTLFLDEIGDLNLESQAKLLRFLEKGEFYRVGSTEKRNIKTRVVSATNKNIESMMEDGSFRKDLYFRIGVVKLQVPSLNDRRSDIIPLAGYFLNNFRIKFGKNIIGFSPEAEEKLLNYNWVGNVRELKNIVERGVLISRGEKISIDDLGIENKKKAEESTMIQKKEILFSIPEEGLDIDTALKKIEKNYIEEAFRLAGGNESRAAKLLNLNHHTFRYRRKKFQR